MHYTKQHKHLLMCSNDQCITIIHTMIYELRTMPKRIFHLVWLYITRKRLPKSNYKILLFSIDISFLLFKSSSLLSLLVTSEVSHLQHFPIDSFSVTCVKCWNYDRLDYKNVADKTQKKKGAKKTNKPKMMEKPRIF